MYIHVCTYVCPYPYPQSIGVQGYSTLHCIRGRVEMRPALERPIKQVERELGNMNITSPTGETPAIPPGEGT